MRSNNRAPGASVLPMTKRSILWIFAAVVIGGVWLYVNRDWFATDRIQIHTRLMPAALRQRRPRAEEATAAPVLFEWNRRLKLKKVEVVAVSDLETNKYPHDLWALTSDSNSVPTRGFVYGLPVPGMHPASKGLDAEPLVPGERYRLFLHAGSAHWEHDFTAEEPAR